MTAPDPKLVLQRVAAAWTYKGNRLRHAKALTHRDRHYHEGYADAMEDAARRVEQILVEWPR